MLANTGDLDYPFPMKARKLIQRRVVLSETAFAEIVIWQVSAAVPGSGHQFKYRLAYVVDGECVLRYDNESGKGDHRHLYGREEPYPFSHPRQLMADFFESIARWNDEQADD